jgi:hypothetical protein
MKISGKTILAMALAAAPGWAEDVTFDARTTGSLGQMHVRKSKKLAITHLNRIKNDYQLQRGITVLGPQSDLLSGLIFIPTAPSSAPAAPAAPAGGGTPDATGKPPNKAQLMGLLPLDLNEFMSLKHLAPGRTGARGARTVSEPVYSEAAVKEYLNRYSDLKADQIIIELASKGFSAAELQTIRNAMLAAARDNIGKMDMSMVAAAMSSNNEAPYLQGITTAETAAYVSSAAYINRTEFFKPLGDQFKTLLLKLTILQQKISDFKDLVAKTDRDLAAALASAQSFAVASDSLDPAKVHEALDVQNKRLKAVTHDVWPFKERAAANNETLQLKQEFAGLASMPGYDDWKGSGGTKDLLSAVSTTLDADVTYINGLKPDGTDRVAALAKATSILARFQSVSSLGKDALTQMEETFTCNDYTQKADYTLIVHDWTGGKTSVSVAVVTFTCYAPLSLSGGIGFNTLRERTYQLVTPAGTATPTSGTTTPPSMIQYDKNSAFQIAPLLLLNVRLCNLQDWGALHASFGAGVSIPASGSGTTSGTGSQATYLGGLSISLRDRLYFTAGPFFGRTNTLANGYSIGSSLPSGVTTIPLQTKFSAGVGVAVTFKLK